ncbi:MAG: helix-turn-helix transcriptional regulator [Planctomycetota bacterium]
MRFEEQVRLIEGILERWFNGPKQAPPHIDEILDPVFVKSSNGTIVHSNKAYREFFASGVAPTGRLATSFLDNSIIEVARHTDALILLGVESVTFRHFCIGPNSDWYLLQSCKKSLLTYGDGAFEILGFSRPISVERSSGLTVEPVSMRHEKYVRMSDRDRRICNLIAEGHSAPEIGHILSVSTKTIENRRKAILHKFDVEHPIEIAKTLVRFEERGLSL